MNDGKLSRAGFTYFISIRSSFISYHCEDNLVMEHNCPNRFSRQVGFYQDVPADLDFDNLSNLKTILRYHHMLTCYGTGSQFLLPGRCNLLERNTTRAFREWWSKMFISSTCSPHASVVIPRGNEVIYLTRTFQRMKANLVLNPSLRLFVLGSPYSLLFCRRRMVLPLSRFQE